MADREVLGEGRHLRLVREDGWEHVERPGITGIAVLVAVTAEGRLLLVEQHRPPVRARVLELPAGLAGDTPAHAGEDPAIAARRELLEETGYEADEITTLAAGPPSAGLTSEVVTFFRARGLRRVAAGGGDAVEQIVVHEVPLDGIDAWLRSKRAGGLLVDPKVYAGLYFLHDR
ncbi:MAG: NUDIX hydrolase [Acidobacteria bacterium]|nr:NUDIX hydrolase [Acidobacteriota bacterium]